LRSSRPYDVSARPSSARRSDRVSVLTDGDICGSTDLGHFCLSQRKVLTPNDFHNLDEVETRLLQFQDYYQQIATPFEWQFTKTDLNDLLARITAHENAQLTPAA
jgi:hypothetical protein